MKSAALMLCLCACAERLGDPAMVAVYLATPRDLELIHSTNENVTGLSFWAYHSLPESVGHLEIAVDGAYRPLAAYVHALRSEDSRVVVGAVLPGQLRDVRMRVALHAPERSYALELGDAVVSAARLDFSAQFTTEVDAVDVQAADPFLGFALGAMERRFDVRLLDGSCTNELAHTDGTSAAARMQVPMPLLVSGAYCVRLVSGGAALEKTVRTRVVLARKQVSADERPIESAVIVLPVLDLELPDASRCEALLSRFSAVFAAAASPSTVVLAPMDLAPGCRHDPEAKADFSSFQAEVAAALLAQPPPIVLAVLITNVPEPLSEALQTFFLQALSYVSGASSQMDVALLAPEALKDPSFVATEAWTYAADPALPGALAGLLAKVLPYRRYAHDASLLYPFYPDGPPEGAFGFKLCGSSWPVAPTVNTTPYATFADPSSGFRFELQTPWLPSFAFREQPVVVDLEACVQFCDQAQGAAWREQAQCGNR